MLICLLHSYIGCFHCSASTRRDLTRTILVDNNPVVFYHQPENGIPVKSFYDDPSDVTLMKLLELLPELDKRTDPETKDIRLPLTNTYNVKRVVDQIVS